MNFNSLLCSITLIVAVIQSAFADSRVSAQVAFRNLRHVKPSAEKSGVGCETTESDDFPLPPQSLPNLVERARLFARTYFTEAELAELRQRLDEARRTGGDRLKVRQVVQDFVNEVLDEERKLQIQSKKSELDKQFGTYV